MLLAEIPSTLRRACISAAAVIGLVATQAHAQTVLIDFGPTLTTNSTNYWNNYTSNTFINLSNSQGTATAYYFTPDSGGQFNTGFVTGSPNLTNIGIFNESTVYSDAMFTTGTNSYYFYNVNTNLTYDFTLFGSRTATNTRTTLYTLQGSNTVSASITTSGTDVGGNGTNYNSSSTATLTGLRPTNYGGGIGNGFLVKVTAQSGGFGYLNAMQADGYLGYLDGGTFDLNTNSAYIQVATNSDGAVSANTVIGGGSTVNVGSASGIYYNSTLIVTNGGGTINRNTNFTVHSLAGAGDLTLGGSEGIAISRAGTYSGTLTINGGTITLSANGALGTGAIVLNGGSVGVNAAQGLGTGNITVASGTTTINNTGSSLDALTGNNQFVLQGGTFQVNGGGKVLNLGTGSVTNTGTTGLNAFNGGMQFNGAISGSGTLNWYGSGSLVLGGSNTFSGTVNAAVNGGSLVLSNVNALQSATLNKGTNHSIIFGLAGGNTYNLGGLTGAGSITLSNGNSLNVNSVASNTYSGALSDSGSLTKSGSGTLILSGANTHSGGTTLSAGQLNINNASALGTGLFTIGNGASFDNTSGGAITNTQNNAVALGSTNTYVGTHSLHLGNGVVTISGNTRLAVNANNLTLGGTVTGADTLSKDGAGTLTLSGSNAMSSFTVVDYGTLRLGHTNALANAQLYLYASGAERKVTFGAAGTNTYNLGALSGASDGILTLGANTVDVGGANLTTSFNGVIEGAGSLIKSGTGSLTLSNANTYSGGTLINGGTLLAGHAQAFGTGSVTIGSGTVLDLGGYVVANSLVNNGGTIYSTGTLDDISATDGTTDIGGNNSHVSSISGNATVNVTGAGAAVTAMSGGNLNVNASGAAVTNFTGGSIGISNGVTVALREGNSSGSISGAGAIEKQGGGTLTLSGTNSHGGGTTLAAGRLNINSASALGTGTFTLGNGASFNNTSGGAISNANNNAVSIAGTNTFAGTDNLHLGNGNVTLGGATRLNVSGGALTLGGSISGSAGFNKDGGGKLTLAGSNAMTSYTVVDFGILELGNVNALANAQLYLYGSTTNKMVTFGVSGSNTYNLGALSGSATGLLTLGGNSVSVGANNVATTYSGAIEGTGGLTKTGNSTLTLAGTNTYSGATTVSSGKLVVNGSVASSSVAIADGAVLGGNGTSGTLTVQNGGTIAPGNSAGTFNINGDIVWQDGGSYDWEIFNLAGPAGSGWDLIDATGSLDLNGLTGASDFVINLLSLSTNNITAGALAGFDASANYDWMIASFSGLSGSFDLSKFTVNAAGFTAYNAVGTGLFSLEISEAEDGLYLTYRAGGAAVPEPGTWAAAALLLAAAGWRWRRQLASREQ